MDASHNGALFEKQLAVSIRKENCACAGYLKEPNLPADRLSFIIFRRLSNTVLHEWRTRERPHMIPH